MTQDDKMDAKLHDLREIINERLELKDRWITDRFAATEKNLDLEVQRLGELREHVEKRFEDQNKAINQRIDCLDQAQEERHEALKEYVQLQFDQRQLRFEDYITSSKEKGELIVTSHMSMHKIIENVQQEFKENVNQQLGGLQRHIDTAREERANYVQRDMLETKLESLEKMVNAKETNYAERMNKIENQQSVNQAKNAQLLIGIGVVLAIVQVIIQFA